MAHDTKIPYPAALREIFLDNFLTSGKKKKKKEVHISAIK
jgi:hypothetical protein